MLNVMMELPVIAIPTLAIAGTVASLSMMALTRAASIAVPALIEGTIALCHSYTR